MRVGSGLVIALALVAGEARADADVQYKGGLVDVRATAAPLAEVLDRLARATGMKVVQQGVTPSMLLSLSLHGRTPAEAVFGVLEGLGLNYAFVLDASGDRIETLVLAGTSGGRPATPTAAASPAPPVQRYVPHPSTPPPAAGPDDAEEAPEEEAAEEADAVDDEEPAAAKAGAGSVPSPRGSVLQPPAEPVFPSSPFAPRAPVFTPQPEPQPQPQPTPTPKPPNRPQQ
jgi:hypothetical protein